jgi:hypothetical protein
MQDSIERQNAGPAAEVPPAAQQASRPASGGREFANSEGERGTCTAGCGKAGEEQSPMRAVRSL